MRNGLLEGIDPGHDAERRLTSENWLVR